MKRMSPTRFLQLASQAQFRSWHLVASPRHKPCLAVRAVKVPCRAHISAHATQSRQLTSAHAKTTDQERLAGAAVAGTRPLAGVTVVSLEQAIAAPFCTRQLADLGARVIKVERPGKGDFARDYDQRVNGLCSHFVWVNRSKESLALDLKNAEDLAVLKQLLGRADVLVQNLAPGATDRLGLSYEALSEANPKLIVCDISGYGSNGPYRNKKAYDLLIQ